MQRLVIAVDCDDVLIATSEALVTDYNALYGTDLSLDDIYQDAPERWGVTDITTALDRVNNLVLSEKYMQHPPIPDALAALVKLRNRHELHVITGRSELLREATELWLETHLTDTFSSVSYIHYYADKYGLTRLPRDKAAICSELEVDVLIDDHLKHAIPVAADGREVLLFGEYPWNQQASLPANIRRAKDWRAVQEYFDERAARR